MRLPSSILGLSAAAILAALPAALAAGKSTDKGQFIRAFTGPDSFQAKKAIEALDPDSEGDFELLKMVLQSGTWYLRTTAANVLVKTENKKHVDKILSWLSEKSERNPLVREGAAVAIAKMKDESLYPKLFEALDDKDPRVRREVAYDLRVRKNKGSISALIERWKKEKDPIVINFIREALESMTQRFLGPDPQDWDNWWASHKDSFEIGSTDEEAKKKAEEEGKALSEGGTTLRDVDLTYVTRGIGAPVIVLPEYGQSNKMQIPFFYELEKAAKMYYFALPKIASFKNLKQAAGRNYYPIDQLVDAFDEFRKTTKSDKIAIIASGMNAWIAMKFAEKYPQKTACIIFIAPISGNKEYGRATDRMIKGGKERNDLELWHLGLTRSVDMQSGKNTHDAFHEKEKLAVPEGENEAIDRKDFTIYFGDQQDSLVDYLYPISHDFPGEVLIPDFELLKSKSAPGVPVMVCVGKTPITASVSDCQEIAKFYGGQLVVFDRSAALPQIEEPEKFNKEAVAFLKRYAKKMGGDQAKKDR
ncbi:MAG TPA: HEAT repeat domain-containing protein [Planctomycetota bacterium]|nr:HEAT repeat domain-containing protein [Planctomycetota bacterium]